MLSTRTIDRTLQAKDYDRLLRDLGRNGLVMPLPVRGQLAQTCTGAMALGLRRAIELAYQPSSLTIALTDKLLAEQAPAGHWPDAEGQPSAALTAAACAGLGRCRRDHEGKLGDQAIKIDQAYIRGMSALSQMQRADAMFAGPADRSDEDRLLTTAFIAYLMVDEPCFAGLCRGHEMLSTLEEHLEDANRTTAELIGMARLVRLAPTPATTTTLPAADAGLRSTHSARRSTSRRDSHRHTTASRRESRSTTASRTSKNLYSQNPS